jgi:hypothetical protein
LRRNARSAFLTWRHFDFWTRNARAREIPEPLRRSDLKNRQYLLALIFALVSSLASASPKSTTIHLKAFDQDLPVGTRVTLKVAPNLKVLGGTAPPEHGPDGKLLPPRPFFLVDEPSMQVLDWVYVTKAGSRESNSLETTFAANLESVLDGKSSRRAVLELPTTYEFASMQANGSWKVEQNGSIVFGLSVEEPVTNYLSGCLRMYHREDGFRLGVARGCAVEDFEEMLRGASCPTGDCPKEE